MTRFAVFPDAEAIVNWVIRQANIDELDDRVYSQVPNTPTYPLCVVRRFGGVPAERTHLDAPRIQVDVWGQNKGQAHDLAQLARVAVMEMEGQTYRVDDGAPVDAIVTGVDDDLGLSWQPDPVTGRDRYLFGVQLYTR